MPCNAGSRACGKVTFSCGRVPRTALEMDGQRILTYTLGEELGHDRLGRVFRARDVRTATPVILRLMRVGGLVSADRVEAVRAQLCRRVRSAGYVAHPNLSVFVDLNPFLDLDVAAWEDSEGEPISIRLGREAPPVETLRWAVETAGAIARAHSRGVPHGRISLSNIVIARDDSVRVLDLGVPRPREIPFLVESDPDGRGVYRPTKRDLRKAMRRDLIALVAVVRATVEADTGKTAEAELRRSIIDAVDEAIEPVLYSRNANAVHLHAALVDVAKRTPADGRAAVGQLVRPSARRQAAAAGDGNGKEPVDPPPQPTRTTRRVSVSKPVEPPPGRPVPFSLDAYKDPSADVTETFGPLRVWSGAAFESIEGATRIPDVELAEALAPEAPAPEARRPEPPPVHVRDEPARLVTVDDPLETGDAPLADPPPITSLFLPPEPEPRWKRFGQRLKIWPHGGIAVGVALAVILGLLGFEITIRPSARSADGSPIDSPAAAATTVDPGADAAGGTGPVEIPAVPPGSPPPVAARGQPAGTLVISASQADVRVSIDGSRAERTPVRWEDVPATAHVIRVEKAGYVTRVDTVLVQRGLTTTRFYVLAPER